MPVTNGSMKIVWWLLGTSTAIALGVIAGTAAGMRDDIECSKKDIVNLSERVAVGETQRTRILDDVHEIKGDVKTLLTMQSGWRARTPPVTGID